MYLFILAYLILLLSLFVYDERFNVPIGEKIDYTTQVVNGPTFDNLANLTLTGTLTCAYLTITSDRRIKKNIQPLEASLELLRQLKPVKYQLKDSDEKEVYGFIAQEVKETIPGATRTQTRIIPTIYEEATCDKDILTFTKFQTSDLSYDAEKKLFDKIKVEEEYVHILEILDEHRIRVDKELPEKVFVLGQEVSDFLSIDSHQIFTVATCAVKELDAKVQRLEEENKALLQRLIRLEERMT